jgi:hypothetical protein
MSLNVGRNTATPPRACLGVILILLVALRNVLPLRMLHLILPLLKHRQLLLGVNRWPLMHLRLHLLSLHLHLLLHLSSLHLFVRHIRLASLHPLILPVLTHIRLRPHLCTGHRQI